MSNFQRRQTRGGNYGNSFVPAQMPHQDVSFSSFYFAFKKWLENLQWRIASFNLMDRFLHFLDFHSLIAIFQSQKSFYHFYNFF
jgi:hypothetical protein